MILFLIVWFQVMSCYWKTIGIKTLMVIFNKAQKKHGRGLMIWNHVCLSPPVGLLSLSRVGFNINAPMLLPIISFHNLKQIPWSAFEIFFFSFFNHLYLELYNKDIIPAIFMFAFFTNNIWMNQGKLISVKVVRLANFKI